MWYAVETAFVDGKHLGSRCIFDMKVVPNDMCRPRSGTCARPHNECPGNTCEKFMNGRIEIHVDWFQTKEQAIKFCNGSLTYIVYMDDVHRQFIKWEAVEVTGDMEPFRGIYKYDRC